MSSHAIDYSDHHGTVIGYHGTETTTAEPTVDLDRATLTDYATAPTLARADKSEDQARRSLVELGLISSDGSLAAPYETRPGDEPVKIRRRADAARRPKSGGIS